MRQRQLIALVAEGLTNQEAAEIMGLTRLVVSNYLRVIYDKLGFWNRVELALWYEAHRHEFENSPSSAQVKLPTT